MEANEIIIPVVLFVTGILVGVIVVPRLTGSYEPLYVPECETY